MKERNNALLSSNSWLRFHSAEGDVENYRDAAIVSVIVTLRIVNFAVNFGLVVFQDTDPLPLSWEHTILGPQIKEYQF